MASARTRRATATLRTRTRENRAATRSRRATARTVAEVRATAQPLPIRSRRATARTAVKVRTTWSLATHVIATGTATENIRGAARALNTVAKKLGIKGRRIRIRRSVDGFRARATTGYRYTRAQVAAIADAYKPRKAEYKVIRAALLAA
ncbi:hypothetical protein ACFCWY_08640 [Streptomyces sp. NPDC056362]|uniref:hypothetical protein n=1 Tax=unclassified Streptomyces TaxID=2593676 RepID=UPI0035DF8B8C